MTAVFACQLLSVEVVMLMMVMMMPEGDHKSMIEIRDIV